DAPATTYRDVDGFCHVASREEIAAQGDVLAPSRYVGSDDEVADPNTPESIAERTNLAVRARRLLSEFDSAPTHAEIALEGLGHELAVDGWQEVQVSGVAR